jgi:DNA replication protein DnaC
MTPNCPIGEWGKLLGDVPSATAILNRFLHHADILSIEGQSYRLAYRQKAQATQQERANQ